ncbi:MAG TPA: hypothetical protein VIX17_12105 [Pyrinomonadaceae bacterium]
MAQSSSRLLLAQLVIVLFAITTYSQSTIPDQPLRVVDYSGDMLAFIGHLPSTFNNSFSFEIDSLEPRSNLTFHVTNATLGDVMNAIVRAKPNYTWRRNGNTIEIYPVGHANPLLETRIDSVRVSNTKLKEALQRLFYSNEVNTAIASSGLRHGPIRGVEDHDERVSVSGAEITLRQDLNQIAETSGVRFWAFELIGPNHDIVSLNFRTEANTR